MNSSASAIDDLLKQGIAAARAGRKGEARQKLLLVVEVDEENEQAWLWLSGAVESNADRRVCLENVLAINPRNAAARQGLRWLDEHAPQPSRREHCPHCQATLPATGNVCAACQRPVLIACPQCQAYVDIVTRQCPHCGGGLGDYRDADYYPDLAEAYLQHNNYEGAAWALDQTAATPDSTALLRLADLSLRLDRLGPAMTACRQALERDPRHVAAYLKLGELYRQQGQYAELQALYRDARRQLPGDATIPIAWARAILDERGSPAEAIELLQGALEQVPEEAEGHALLARAYLRADHLSAALAHYRHTVELAPAGSALAIAAQRELESLKHVEPEGWGEFTRHMLGFMLCPICAALSTASLSPLRINFVSWMALLVALIASGLWVSSADMPRNPVTVKIFGSAQARQLHSPQWNAFGKFLWALAFTVLVIRG